MSTFRPLLAEKVDLSILQYPCLASPKYDGFRCIIDGGGYPMSRNMKPIRNSYVYGKLRELDLPKIDGELLTYTGGKVDDFNTVQSKLSTQSGLPEFSYKVFDYWAVPSEPFSGRYERLESWFMDQYGVRGMDRLGLVPQIEISNEEELLDYEAKCLEAGWEGIMIRSFDGVYKMGRSTVREGILLKLKRFFDDEATVLSAHELMHNANEATVNSLGYTERSSHKANMRGMGVLGKLTVRWTGKDVEFDIGTGFDAGMRERYWNQDLVGRTLTFKYQSIGPNGKPRFPVFLGFREDA